MKSIKILKEILHYLGLIFVPGYWIAAIIVYVHHKVKHKPVKIRQEEKKIQKDMIEKKNKVKKKITKKKQILKTKIKVKKQKFKKQILAR